MTDSRFFRLYEASDLPTYNIDTIFFCHFEPQPIQAVVIVVPCTAKTTQALVVGIEFVGALQSKSLHGFSPTFQDFVYPKKN